MRSHVSFGFGRRICVGRHIANDTLFAVIAMLLWAIDIEPATDEKGASLPLDVDGCIEDGVVVCVVLVRHYVRHLLIICLAVARYLSK